MRKLVTLNVSHPEADVPFATIMVPPPNSAQRYFPLLLILTEAQIHPN